MNKPVLKLENISKTFHQGGEPLNVLKNISLEVKKGEMVALVGPSGCGKSTLMHIAGLLENPGSGDVVIDGVIASELGDSGRTKMRREKIGFVYQYHHLMAEFSALENIIMPQIIAGESYKNAEKRARKLLKDLGLAEREKHIPAELSGGEQQRVAIARALANSPSILLADEPTGNLDPDTADSVFALLLSLVKNSHLSLLMVTHNPEIAKKCSRILKIKSGMLA